MSKGSRKQGPRTKIRYDKQQRRAVAATTTQPPAQHPDPAPRAHAAAFRRRPTIDPTPAAEVVRLQPLAPLVIRSGRPFDANSGVDASRFPPPSTLAGCLRTAWARAHGEPFGPHLASLAVAGPLLVRTSADQRRQWLLPKPADANYFRIHGQPTCVAAVPTPYPAGAGSDLPDGLLPVALRQAVEGKAITGPRWWDWEDVLRFRRGEPLAFDGLQQRGWSPPQGDRRTHVAIDPQSGAAEAARLFQTEGLDFEPDNPRLQEPDTAPLELLARCGKPLHGALVHLGGERRLARLTPAAASDWPAPPPDWWRRIREARGLSLSLVTPAPFAAGFRPGWLDARLCGSPPEAPRLELRLRAVAVERWEPHSGWDLAQAAPRATRRLAPAGAVYWFELLTVPGDEALAALWLASICDDAQDRLDGFGLAVPAPWSPTA